MPNHKTNEKEDNIKIDLMKMSYEAGWWLKLAQDRV
jgi:hypothetical protein